MLKPYPKAKIRLFNPLKKLGTLSWCWGHKNVHGAEIEIPARWSTVPSCPRNKGEERQPQPTPVKALEEPPLSAAVEEVREELRGMEIKGLFKEAGKQKKRREEIEARIGQLPPGWEWIWLQDPWTQKWERLRVLQEEADYRQRSVIPPQPSYWGEVEAREWRRKLREEKVS